LRSKIQVIRQILFLGLSIGLGLYSCNSQKETAASRNMQNLTAQYNILYNAKEIVNESERNIQSAYTDDYDRIISVFKEPNENSSQGELSKLDQAILKSNTIANEKSQSKYVDDAYFLIGKSNHLKSNFFNAVEFFDYVYLNYPKEKKIKQAALAWKTRSLIASDRLEEAYNTIDSALKYISIEKRSVADIYAIRAQLHIYAQEDVQAISMLEKAIGSRTNKENKIRWTYLLAQLQQVSGQDEAAYLNFKKVLKSNSAFEMAFNANLSSITLKNKLTKDPKSRSKQITALLKDSKNSDFHDQIYFQIANSFAEEGNIEAAIENYNNAISKSTKNVIQKGLAYLKLAEIYFKESDYIKSKAYYDSTLVTLPEIYPGYVQIKKKADNIELLADRLSTIAKEDTLQMLAKLPEAERNAKIKTLVEQEEIKALAKINSAASDSTNSKADANNRGNIKFYFYNPIALKQGIVDFKKTWGTRKLEDNWRRSEKSAADISNALAMKQETSDDPFLALNKPASSINTDSLTKVYKESIPLSVEMRKESNEKIGAAMYDIGTYYREVASDTLEAITTYEQLLRRFPEDPNKLPVYYNLYRLYKYSNPQLSDKYKNILLDQFPESPFAKIIIDPDYNQKNDEKEVAFNKFYNDVFDLYTSKKYSDVLKLIEDQTSILGDKKMPAQLAYLNSLALGHLQKLDKLEESFKTIVEINPEDQLIVPLIKIQLAFIDSNRTELSNRPYALLDNETIINSVIEEPIYQKPAIVNTVPAVVAVDKPAIASIPTEKIVKKDLEPVKVPEKEQKNLEIIKPPVLEQKTEVIKPVLVQNETLFELSELGTYYFVVNVNDPAVNLSSSRFGIGQYNRVNYSGNSIKHQLRPVADQNQLIFVGPLDGKEAAQTYYNLISPLMKDIMKVPATNYSTFIISDKNFEKITDLGTLNQYVDFYKKNFNK